MGISKEQAEQIKLQIIEQIESSFPEDKKESAIQKINEMSQEELEDFLAKNNLSVKEGGQGECIFCSIIDSKIPSYKIDECREAVAVLELNPASDGHVLIIPKIHSGEISDEIKKFSERISKKLKIKLKPKKVALSNSNVLGHSIINIIPVYSDESLQGKRKKASEEELEIMKKKLQYKPKKEKKEKHENTSEIKILPNRIP